MTEVVDRTASAQHPTGSKGAAATGAEPVVDVAALGEQLLGKWAHIRHEARKVAGNPVVQKIEGLHHTEHRARVFEQLKFLVDNNTVHRAFPTRLGGSDDHGGNIAGFEEIVTADPSLQI